MEPDITQPNFTRTEVPLTEPHFDEESTVMSARPVVPLEEVKSQTRSRSRLIFAGAIVLALIVGIAGGTFLLRQLENRGSKPVVETADPAAEASQTVFKGDAAGGAQVDETTTVARDNETDQDQSVNGVPPAAAPDREPAPRVERVRIEPRNAPEPRPVQRENRGESDKEARRAARQEERRLKREARREARRSHDSDDLLRIREIFEGSPRP